MKHLNLLDAVFFLESSSNSRDEIGVSCPNHDPKCVVLDRGFPTFLTRPDMKQSFVLMDSGRVELLHPQSPKKLIFCSLCHIFL